MTERFLQHVRVEVPPPDEVAAGARVRLAERFPRNALRRMTHLGLLLGSTMEGMTLGPDDAAVFASTFSETRALEDFLQGFPAASPLLFQTSIHPGAVQQVQIGRQQPVGRLWPLASRTRLVEQALLTAVLEPARRVAILGGEERGTWMLEQGMAAPRAFAFAVLLTGEAAGALGRVIFDAATSGPDASPGLEDFTQALAGRRALRWTGPGGTWTLDWQ
ncbi:MAG TPA: hypothetical protein VHN79_06495 [Lacunisphaera sp.]|nr:hypothetical protein [Lacunisphaera sp.]